MTRDEHYNCMTGRKPLAMFFFALMKESHTTVGKKNKLIYWTVLREKLPKVIAVSVRVEVYSQ